MRPSMAAAAIDAIASSPASSSTSPTSRSCSSTARASCAYCSLTMRVIAASVIATNGVSYGTMNTGNPSRSAAFATAGGRSGRWMPTANPSPARPAPASRSM